VEFNILGPFEVRDSEGATIQLPGGRERSLLTLLLIHRGEVVSSDRIVDALWGERAPGTAGKAVQGYISHLRRVLEPGREPGDGGGVLVTRPPGYVLRTDGLTVDAVRFERLAGDGRRALEDGSADEAIRLLDEALALWRGPALAEGWPARAAGAPAPAPARARSRAAGGRRGRPAARRSACRCGRARASPGRAGARAADSRRRAHRAGRRARRGDRAAAATRPGPPSPRAGGRRDGRSHRGRSPRRRTRKSLSLQLPVTRTTRGWPCAASALRLRAAVAARHSMSTRAPRACPEPRSRRGLPVISRLGSFPHVVSARLARRSLTEARYVFRAPRKYRRRPRSSHRVAIEEEGGEVVPLPRRSGGIAGAGRSVC
jgi:hypothetical protein